MKVFIVGMAGSYADMYLQNGWEISDNPDDADLLQFTGGEDVVPTLYGEVPHPFTSFNMNRDQAEVFLFDQFKGKKPMAGICRGGQFLNVMNGGKLYQHVDNHAISGTHSIEVLNSDTVLQVTSTHHQMMRHHEDGKVLAVSHLSTSKEYMSKNLRVIEYADPNDVEVVLYPKSRCLCFQPHPEFDNAPEECTKYYFELIDELMEKN